MTPKELRDLETAIDWIARSAPRNNFDPQYVGEGYSYRHVTDDYDTAKRFLIQMFKEKDEQAQREAKLLNDKLYAISCAVATANHQVSELYREINTINRVNTGNEE